MSLKETIQGSIKQLEFPSYQKWRQIMKTSEDVIMMKKGNYVIRIGILIDHNELCDETVYSAILGIDGESDDFCALKICRAPRFRSSFVYFKKQPESDADLQEWYENTCRRIQKKYEECVYDTYFH